MRRLIASGVAATAALIGLALPADAAATWTIDAVCDHATVTLTGYPAGTVAKVWTKQKTGNYSLVPNRQAIFEGDWITTVYTARSTSSYNQQTVKLEVAPGGDYTQVFTVGKPFNRC